MDVQTIEDDFRDKVCAKLSIRAEGVNRYRIFTPFRFEDGDHLVTVLKRESGEWMLSDEGHTYMHLTYDIDEYDLGRGNRQQIIANALSVFDVADHDGELQIKISDANYGDALYNFVQALLKITDVTFLSRERVRSTFLEDFRTLIVESTPDNRRQFEWHDPRRDPEGKYTITCRINEHTSPLFVYALQNDDQTRDATISIHQFEKWGLIFRSVAVFENQEEINRRVLARFSDVCDKQYSNIGTNKERITQYVRSAVGIITES